MNHKKNIIRKAVIPFLKIFDLYSLAQLRDRGPLVDYGWFRSFNEKKPVDKSGNPLPWFSYPMLYFLEKRINSHCTVFEFGAGNSTLWWAERVSRVIACEHNIDWYNVVQKNAPSNVQLIYIDLVQNKYPEALTRTSNKFDIIVIDGEERVACTKKAISYLTPEGGIILDDSDRAEYSEAAQYLISHGFRQVEFYGMTACVNVGKETSLFYRSGNCLNI